MTFHYLDAPATNDTALATLPAALASWFAERFGEPTTVQRLAWPALAAGGHLLVSAATGTGKTLAALLPILGELLSPFESESWSTSPLRVVYVAPLKALVNDAARNVRSHLDGLRDRLPADAVLPRLAIRTGDTAGQDRRALRDEPPDVLLTTPESLAVLLSHGWSSELFANLSWVVVDEVHALAGNKRGADLALSIERLAAISTRPVRRVGLSATAAPLPEAARFVAGTGRDCSVVRAPQTAAPSLCLEPLPEGGRFLSALVERLAAELPGRRAVLIFTNTRALAERLSWALRRKMSAWDALIAVHHSALSAARRREIEERFKHGELRAVVASTSLELGIDVGGVDLAVLIHPPGDVIRLLQRVGRAGHEPGAVRRGLILTASAGELLEAAVTIASGLSGQCEPLRLSPAPLDVLCQQIIGACCARSWPADELYALCRRAAPFADLTRADFDDCLAYLRGIGRGESWLPARLVEDGDCWRVAEGTARILRRNVGTILTETTVPVIRREAEGDVCTPIGEVDESFADRLQPGDRFLLDGRCLEFRAREEGSAVVVEVVGRPQTPRWAGDGWPLSAELARRLFVLRTRAAEALREGEAELAKLLRDDYGLEGEAMRAVADHFAQQESVSEIPAAATLLIEGIDGERGLELYLHTPLNRPANDALARVAVARLVREYGRSATSEVADLGFLLRLRGDAVAVPDLVRSLLRADGFGATLDDALAQSEALRTRFSRVAQTGLMVLRQPEGRRRRVGGGDWNERRLFESVRDHDADFVLLRQSLRELRRELCDAAAALEYARHLPALTVRCRWLSRPSPFASAWTQRDDGAAEQPLTSAEALTLLHAELTRGEMRVLDDEWLLTRWRMAVHLPSATAVVADLHLGYDRVRRRNGEAVPVRPMSDELTPLLTGLRETTTRRLIVAGDLFEDARVERDEMADEFAACLASAGVELVAVVPGNHDRGLGDREALLRVRKDGVELGRFLIVHGDGELPARPLVHGHDHPWFRWRPGVEGPCYLVGEDRLVLPAYSRDAAGANVRGKPRWAACRCCVIAGEVLDFGPLGRLV